MSSPLSFGRLWQKSIPLHFLPGDHILFSAGCRWNGKLHPKGSGIAGNLIVIDRYGDGAPSGDRWIGSCGRWCRLFVQPAILGSCRSHFWDCSPHPPEEPLHPSHQRDNWPIPQAKDVGAIGILIEADDVKDTRF